MGDKIISGYGSIPHLSASKLNQQADKKISLGQELILTKKTRDWKDLIIVTEKLDGSNVAITRKGNDIIAVGRSGYTADSSPYEQHRVFASWVKKNEEKFKWLPDGWKICGEWMHMVHGTRYDLTGFEPFFAFDIIRADKSRMLYLQLLVMACSNDLQMVPLIHIGQPISVKNALKSLGDGSYYDGNDKPEGVVYRCERDKHVDFIAKFVREDKIDGKYMHLEEKQKGIL